MEDFDNDVLVGVKAIVALNGSLSHTNGRRRGPQKDHGSTDMRKNLDVSLAVWIFVLPNLEAIFSDPFLFFPLSVF